MKKVNTLSFKLVAILVLFVAFVLTLLLAHWAIPIVISVCLFFLIRNVLLCLKAFFFNCFNILNDEAS